MPQILIIEDDPAIRKGLTIALQEASYKVETAENGLSGFNKAQNKSYDLIILDLMLPGKNGQDICRELRQADNQVPIIMLTSKKEEIDKVLGLELGADDYITKPFGVHELLARIKAVLRRARPKAPAEMPRTLRLGSVEIDFEKMLASKNGQPMKLTAREFELLRFFAQHEDEVISRDRLLDEVWGYDSFPTTRTIDTFVLNLRKKIEDDPAHPKHLLTVHKLGYRFVLRNEEKSR
jgi:DNA-binding response OmpR family regulator